MARRLEHLEPLGELILEVVVPVLLPEVLAGERHRHEEGERGERHRRDAHAEGDVDGLAGADHEPAGEEEPRVHRAARRPPREERDLVDDGERDDHRRDDGRRRRRHQAQSGQHRDRRADEEQRGPRERGPTCAIVRVREENARDAGGRQRGGEELARPAAEEAEHAGREGAGEERLRGEPAVRGPPVVREEHHDVHEARRAQPGEAGGGGSVFDPPKLHVRSSSNRWATRNSATTLCASPARADLRHLRR